MGFRERNTGVRLRKCCGDVIELSIVCGGGAGRLMCEGRQDDLDITPLVIRKRFEGKLIYLG